VLVATKLHVPEARRGLVPRRGLVETLVGATSRKLVLVCAPAGWGKTVLLSEWAASTDEDRPFAWVSLDPGDSDPVRFWRYVIGALGVVEAGLGEASLAALASAGADLVDIVVSPLINDLASYSRPLVLVLDDYHLIHSEPVHAALGFLLRHLPRNVQLAIASRADPPLPLASLRAGDEITEIRAAALGFNEAEAQAFLNDSLGLGLDADEVGLLRNRTEGWAAGLQLAALSLRAHDGDRSAYVQTFAGADRHIGDYLHELLAEQPEALRDFLLRTAILERMCAPLCNALTDRTDADASLRQIERSNLFLVALDPQHEWYRYHHLFRDLLRRELVRSSPDVVAELHRRASGWHREHGDPDEAIAHAIAAGGLEDAAELIDESWRTCIRAGQTETVVRWIDALPDESVAADKRLALARGWAALYRGRLDEVEALLRDPAAAGLPGPFYNGLEPAANLAFLEAVYTGLRGEVGRSLDAARTVIRVHPEDDESGLALANLVLGRALYYAGDPDAAVGVLEHAVAGLLPGGGSVALLAAVGGLALAQAETGAAERAAVSAAQAEKLVESLGLKESGWAALPLLARATLLELRGQVQEAASELRRAVVVARRGARRLDLGRCLISLARVERRLHDHTAARAHAREARAVLETCPDPGMLTGLLAQTERSLQLARNAGHAATASIDADLSERELTVLRLLASDMSQREIGSELFISLNTVKGHVRNIFRKLAVTGRAEAVTRARELDLI
jgi:LuxR family transcriptional regulator, maltose regulon positive regulatory protein